MVEARDIGVMAEVHDFTGIVGERPDNIAQPVDELGRHRAVGLNAPLDEGRANGIIGGVERDDAPMVVLEAEKLPLCPPGLPRTPSFRRRWSK